jgi:hypothetical protein
VRAVRHVRSRLRTSTLRFINRHTDQVPHGTERHHKAPHDTGRRHKTLHGTAQAPRGHQTHHAAYEPGFYYHLRAAHQASGDCAVIRLRCSYGGAYDAVCGVGSLRDDVRCGVRHGMRPCRVAYNPTSEARGAPRPTSSHRRSETGRPV